MGINRVEFSGGITAPPKISTTERGTIWNAPLAVSGTRYSHAERKEIVKTTHLYLQAFAAVADRLNELGLGVGDQVYLVGEMDQSTYEKPDGTKEQKTRITVFTLDPLRLRGARRAAPVPPADDVPAFLGDDDPWANVTPRSTQP